MKEQQFMFNEEKNQIYLMIYIYVCVHIETKTPCCDLFELRCLLCMNFNADILCDSIDAFH
jgi:hypothetical protein